MLVSILGAEKPTSIGKTEDLKKWAMKKLKGKAKKADKGSSKKKASKKTSKKSKSKKKK